jgi:hypothetical protein
MEARESAIVEAQDRSALESNLLLRSLMLERRGDAGPNSPHDLLNDPNAPSFDDHNDGGEGDDSDRRAESSAQGAVERGRGRGRGEERKVGELSSAELAGSRSASRSASRLPERRGKSVTRLG